MKGAAGVIAAVLLFAGCGSSAASHLSIYNEPERLDAFGPGAQPGLHPGQRMQWRVAVYNLGRNDITLDRVELAVSKGVTLHDSWTLTPAARAGSLSAEWAVDRAGWNHDRGARAVAGTVVPPVSDTRRDGKGGIWVSVDVTMGGFDGAVEHIDGIRVWEHEGHHRFVVVLPIGVSACFGALVSACPMRSSSATLAVLGLQ